MMNLDGVIDDYLEDVEPVNEEIASWKDAINQEAVAQALLLGGLAYYDPTPDKSVAGIGYQFKNGVIKFDFSNSNRETVIPIKEADEYYMSWGWFEDHILNSFFSIDINITNSKGTTPQKGLYSLGLDTIILPGQTIPEEVEKELNDEIKRVAGEVLTSRLRKAKTGEDTKANKKILDELTEQRKILKKVLITYKIIDEHFKPFGKPEEGLGNIRNIVFNTEYLKAKFEGINSIQEGIRSLFGDIAGKYGGFF